MIFTTVQIKAFSLPKKEGFTLFEVMLALALSATLFMLLSLGIHLFLFQADASRSTIEEAQIVRNVLAMLERDIRSTIFYTPQDISNLETIAEKNATFDVNKIDEEKTETTETTLNPPGLLGTETQLLIDYSRTADLEESMRVTNSEVATHDRYSSDRVVLYFIREGEQAEPGDPSVVNLAQENNNQASIIAGLIRQEWDRAAYLTAQETGNPTGLESGQQLLAPEILALTFTYYNQTETFTEWDSDEKKGLPNAIKITISIRDQISAPQHNSTDPQEEFKTREYSLTVFLPMSSPSEEENPQQ